MIQIVVGNSLARSLARLALLLLGQPPPSPVEDDGQDPDEKGGHAVTMEFSVTDSTMTGLDGPYPGVLWPQISETYDLLTV